MNILHIHDSSPLWTNASQNYLRSSKKRAANCFKPNQRCPFLHFLVPLNDHERIMEWCNTHPPQNAQNYIGC